MSDSRTYGEAEPRFRVIDDWSLAARAELATGDGDQIRALLDASFSTLLDERDVSLARYGFNKTDDPVSEAVSWCMDRFATGDLDPAQIDPQHHSFRLFTQPGFWLAQKVGARAHAAIRHEQRRRVEVDERIDAASSDDAAEDARQSVSTLESDAVRTLPRLHASTCANMVTFWLQGTVKIRGEWFGWAVEAPDPPVASASEASKRMADALFRFLVLFWEMLAGPDRALSVQVCEASCFSPCKNAAPYWNDPSEAARPLGVVAASDAKRLRKDGVVALLGACVDRAHDPGTERGTHPRLRAAFTRRTLRKSLVDVYRLGPAGTKLFAELDALAGEERS